MLTIPGPPSRTCDGITRRSWLRIGMPGEADGRYIDPASGQVLEHGEITHAVALARHFSGERQAAIVSVTRVDAFSDEYPAVNRLLPVWRVAFEREDRLRAFVDTAHGRLGTLVDERKYRLARTFMALHTWQWAEGSRLRLLLMGLLLAAAAMAGAVVLAEQFDTSFHSIDDVREFTAVPVLATIPQIGAAPRRGWARATLGTASAVAAVAVVATLSAYLAHGNATLVRLLQRAG